MILIPSPEKEPPSALAYSVTEVFAAWWGSSISGEQQQKCQSSDLSPCLWVRHSNFQGFYTEFEGHLRGREEREEDLHSKSI